jgi:hypothetical protein
MPVDSLGAPLRFYVLTLATSLCVTASFPLAGSAQRERAKKQMIAGADTTQDARVPVVSVGMPTADSFTFAALGSSFRAEIQIEADSVGGEFRVTASPLAGPGGLQVRARHWIDKGFAADSSRQETTIEPFGDVSLVLQAELPAAGSYRGMFSIITPRSRRTHAYTVTRARRVQPVAHTGGGAVRVQTRGREVIIPFALHDTSGAVVELHAPSLEELRWVHGADTTFAVQYGSAYVRRVGGTDSLGAILLAPNRSEELEMVIKNAVDGAGTYTGKIRVAGPDFAPFSIPLKLYAREGKGAAMFLIVIGIVLAEGIRRIRGDVRPRWQRQREAAALVESLAKLEQQIAEVGAVAEEERRVLDHLNARLRSFYEDPNVGTRADADPFLADMRKRLERLPDWVNLRRRIAALQPAELRDDLHLRLDPVRDYLLASKMEDDASASNMSTVLHGLPDEIQKSLRAHLDKQIDEFMDLVKQERAAHPSDDSFLEFVEANVHKRLKEAKSLVDADQLTQAVRAFDDARIRYVDLLLGELRLRLDQPRPSWVDDTGWNKLRSTVSAELERIGAAMTPEQKLAGYEQVQALYLREAARTLAEAARKQLAIPNLEMEGKEHLEKTTTHAQESQSLAAIPDLQGAGAAFREAETAWEQYRELLVKRQGVRMSTTDTTMAASPPGVLPKEIRLVAVSAPVARVYVPLSSGSLASRILWLDLLMSGLAALFAMFLGVQLLWDPDLTWGTSADKFAALLWGLGLQQAGNEMFRGVADLVGRVGGTPQKATT